MPHAASYTFDIVFLTLQACVVAFLLLHDFVPLGRLNNLSAMRSQYTLVQRIVGMLIPTIPTGLALYFSAQHIAQTYPHGLWMLLWISYVILFAGILQAWWIPYLLVPDPARATRYETIFRGTHTFLPQRNGLAPDTLHTLFHVVFLAAFLMLLLRSIG